MKPGYVRGMLGSGSLRWFIPVRAVFDEQSGNLAFCDTAWAPSEEELVALNKGAQIVVRVGGGQPPIQVEVE